MIRAAQSKPIDLVCIRHGKPVMVECKAGKSYMGVDRKKELLGLSEQSGAPIILARRRRKKVELTNLLDGTSLDPENLAGLLTL